MVAFVAPNDMLNVRDGPGIDNSIVEELAPGTGDIVIMGVGQEVEGSTWVPISGPGEGWVNSRYLTGEMTGSEVCGDTAVYDLLSTLETAVTTEDGELLASLLHPERGLRIRTAWWNPEVQISTQLAPTLFTSSTEYDWGVQEGSGLPLLGTFSDVILPDLQRDLPGAQLTCDQHQHGPTAGIVQLPDEYGGLHFLNAYRPATDESGFDWGAWAVGIEFWQGRYYLSFLVHYAYEL
jgi:hypothetical protein